MAGKKCSDGTLHTDHKTVVIKVSDPFTGVMQYEIRCGNCGHIVDSGEVAPKKGR